MKGWNHGYLGIALVVLGYFIEWYWLVFVGAIIVVDEVIQIVTGRQYGGLLHTLYVNTLYKIPIVKKFNIWMDKLFGKEL